MPPQLYETDKDLEAQITANIQNLQNFYGLNSVNSLQQLAKIILDPKKSNLLFKQRNVTVSSIFQQNKNPFQINETHAKLFAEKYTFQKLVQKFPKPKGQTSRMLVSILQKKLIKQTIASHQTRKNLWLLASGAKFKMNHYPGLYQKILAYQNYPQYFVRAINQDINRTVAKKQTSQQQLKSLTNLLIAFSRRNPFVGYCQGLNFVAYFLLTMQFQQQEAFWLLTQLIQTIIPMDYYTNMVGVVCDQQVFLACLRQMYPKIVKKFDEVGLDPSILSIEWFVCLFTSSLPFYLVKVVWDRLLIQGSRAFIKAGLILMKHFEQQILAVQQFQDEIILLLEKGTKSLTYPESQFNLLFEKIYINRQGLVLARTLYRQYHLKDKLADKNIGKKSFQQPVCNVQWPICVASLQKSKKIKNQTEVWIFRQNKSPKIDPQYLLKYQEKHKQKPIAIKQVKINDKKQINFSPLKSIAQQTQSQYDTASQLKDDSSMQELFLFNNVKSGQKSKQIKKINQQVQKQLMIGRIAHICQSNNVQKLNSQKKIRKSFFNDQIQNQELKKQTTKIIIDNQDQQKLGRSQTIAFFSKFLHENTQLSNIIIPSSKIYQCQ